MGKTKIILKESQLRKIISETVQKLLEYNDDFLNRVNNCKFLSDDDKKKIQYASMASFDNREKKDKIEQEIEQMKDFENPNLWDKHLGYKH